MTKTADVVRMSGDECGSLMDEREILRQEAARAWREVDFIAKERTEHLEWRTKLANDLDECERMRDALRAELREATEAMDDPAVNNLRTLPEAIRMLRAERDALLSLIADDAFASSFQTMAQYRSALLKATKGGGNG